MTEVQQLRAYLAPYQRQYLVGYIWDHSVVAFNHHDISKQGSFLYIWINMFSILRMTYLHNGLVGNSLCIESGYSCDMKAFWLFLFLRIILNLLRTASFTVYLLLYNYTFENRTKITLLMPQLLRLLIMCISHVPWMTVFAIYIFLHF